ncbi:sporulation inhibitor of replication protein SirA [Aquibacillus salsiterrae]|uniref:Sporulation inhibitor of replication protein SirA n=1 Tax=Aquibacillus salsiterrae TaxID=2950439 RepID=A0A9X3WDT7_9BACI|nr:sporulation inhibitor of replication protein SirA [Aquibacillus salsiterrae]MDC3416295.1 sporulation inhibitor of replication protein SirA [Aquibacillus salsiterrae]
MQKYSIFWIEEEFCYHYFYRSEILYRFLNEYLSYTSRTDLLSQFTFVTRNLPYNTLLTHFKNYHGDSLKLEMTEKGLVMEKGNSSVCLELFDRYITVQAFSVEEADRLLFQCLKSFDPSFFIIESETTNCGWITPIKKEVLL